MNPVAEQPGRRQALVWGGAVVALAAALLVALVLPLGAAEAPSLGWLKDAATPGMGWGEPFRHLIARAAATPDRPLVCLLAAAVVLKSAPAVGALFALRLPDVLAAALVAAIVVRVAETRSAGVFAALLFVASPALWAAVVGSPGLLVDAAAVAVLYAVARRPAVRPRAGALLGLLLALVVLIYNGAGVYAIAVGLGVWLHAGLAHGEWRLFASGRLTVLAGLIIAGLTLVGVLDLPAGAHWLVLYRKLDLAIERSALPVPVGIIAAAVIVPSLIALAETLRRPAGMAGQLLSILAIGAIVLSCAPRTPPLAVTALAPLTLLWWTTPLMSTEARGRALLAAGFYVLAGVAAAGALLILGRAEPSTQAALAWASRGVAILMASAALLALALAWRGTRVAPAGAASLALAAVIAAGALWLAAPQQLFAQRGYDRQLAEAMAPLQARPIAVLAPVGAPLWRAELGRPVFVARDVFALCRWAAARDGTSAPLALVRPQATDAVLGRFAGARLLLQSPGTPQTSVMVIELGDRGSRGCRAGH
ncbi:hypothetical protein [Salinisphaera sp. LB1]|uniref:hypothetical protein n=1 Tax=Salinisphaera sp. LB1 TaxID=2183911 RepID=UPI000D70616A|nr:hypothetical protein [Salinisphaera sp. LB1]AWN16873.1 hypothetical protein SALB1_2677 [Salinisphaera sp. LB1]